MRKIIAWNVSTLDGFFEGAAPWDLSFHETIWGPELEAFSLEQLDNMDSLLFGRKTYQGMADYWAKETGDIADRMNTIKKFVATQTLSSADWANTTILNGDIIDAVKDLKVEEGKDIFVFGSAALLDTLLRHHLVDEYRIGLAPIVLGSGTSLFKSANPALNLQLLEARPLSNGGVILKYKPRYP